MRIVAVTQDGRSLVPTQKVESLMSEAIASGCWRWPIPDHYSAVVADGGEPGPFGTELHSGHDRVAGRDFQDFLAGIGIPERDDGVQSS